MHWWTGAIGIPLGFGLAVAALATDSSFFLLASVATFVLTIGLDMLIVRGSSPLETALYLCLGIAIASFVVLVLALEIDMDRGLARALSVPVGGFLLFAAVATIPDFARGVLFSLGHFLGRKDRDSALAYMRGDTESAIASLNAHLEAHPEDVAALTLRAGILLEQGKWEEAVEQSIEAMNRSSEPDRYVIRASLLTNSGDYHAALEDYQTALGIQPDDHLTQLGFGAVLLVLRRIDQALRVIEPLIDQKSQPQMKLLLAEAYLANGDEAQAEALFHNVEKAAANLVRFGFAIDQVHAAALMRLGRAEEALEAADRALAQKPCNLIAHWTRSYIYAKASMLDETLAALKPYAECHPGSAVTFIDDELADVSDPRFIDLRTQASAERDRRRSWLRERLGLPPAELLA